MKIKYLINILEGLLILIGALTIFSFFIPQRELLRLNNVRYVKLEGNKEALSVDLIIDSKAIYLLKPKSISLEIPKIKDFELVDSLCFKEEGFVYELTKLRPRWLLCKKYDQIDIEEIERKTHLIKLIFKTPYTKKALEDMIENEEFPIRYTFRR